MNKLKDGINPLVGDFLVSFETCGRLRGFVKGFAEVSRLNEDPERIKVFPITWGGGEEDHSPEYKVHPREYDVFTKHYAAIVTQSELFDLAAMDAQWDSIVTNFIKSTRWMNEEESEITQKLLFAAKKRMIEKYS